MNGEMKLSIQSELWLNDLASDLKSDREEIRRQLWIIRLLVLRGEYEFAEKRARELVDLTSHFAREVCDMESAFSRPLSSGQPSEKRIDSTIRERETLLASFREMQGLLGLASERERFECFEKFETSVLNVPSGRKVSSFY